MPHRLMPPQQAKVRITYKSNSDGNFASFVTSYIMHNEHLITAVVAKKEQH